MVPFRRKGQLPATLLAHFDQSLIESFDTKFSHHLQPLHIMTFFKSIYKQRLLVISGKMLIGWTFSYIASDRESMGCITVRSLNINRRETYYMSPRSDMSLAGIEHEPTFYEANHTSQIISIAHCMGNILASSECKILLVPAKALWSQTLAFVPTSLLSCLAGSSLSTDW